MAIICLLFSPNLLSRLYAEEWPGLNYNAFRNTIAWPLAKAVKSQNVKEIANLVNIERIPVDFQDSDGNTLLMVAILTKKNRSISKLLELGANPNIRANDGYTPFLFACSIYTQTHLKLEIFEELLRYGADINTKLDVDDNRGYYFRTPLIESVDISYRFRKDRLFYFLLASGAEVNIFNNDSTFCLLRGLVVSERIDLLKYIVIEKKIKVPLYVYVKRDENNVIILKRTLIDELERVEYDRTSLNYQYSQEIITYLKNNVME